MFLIQALDTLEHLSLRDYVYEEASRGLDLISSRGQGNLYKSVAKWCMSVKLGFHIHPVRAGNLNTDTLEACSPSNVFILTKI